MLEARSSRPAWATQRVFFGEDAVNRGNALLDKYLLEGAITQEEYEKLLEENRTMECDEVWVPEDH